MATEKRVIPPVPEFVDPERFASMADIERQWHLYSLLHHVATRINAIETEAGEMMDPDKMMEMATRFLGGGSL